MILDAGICTVFRKTDISKRGNMPKYEYKPISKHWYGELQFETSPANPTDGREEVQTDARIRIVQNRQLNNHDMVVFANTNNIDDVIKAYEITRAFHGRDDESGELITDLTLRRVKP
jgi:hypothetical protein